MNQYEQTLMQLKYTFFDVCINEFKFLIDDYDCRIIECVQDHSNISITYANLTTGIEISLEPRENYIFVYLIRLHEGTVPQYLTSPRSWIYLDAILSSLRPPLKIIQNTYGDWLKPEDVKEIIKKYAQALREHGSDVLTGDFKIFRKLKETG
jgi:hypothetical protein